MGNIMSTGSNMGATGAPIGGGSPNPTSSPILSMLNGGMGSMGGMGALMPISPPAPGQPGVMPGTASSSSSSGPIPGMMGSK